MIDMRRLAISLRGGRPLSSAPRAPRRCPSASGREAGLLPALGATMTAAPEAVLATNDSGHYECRPSLLKLENGGSCVFTRGMKPGRVVTFISAHAEGKFLLPQNREKKMLKELVDNDQVVFRFVDDR